MICSDEVKVFKYFLCPGIVGKSSVQIKNIPATVSPSLHPVIQSLGRGAGSLSVVITPLYI